MLGRYLQQQPTVSERIGVKRDSNESPEAREVIDQPIIDGLNFWQIPEDSNEGQDAMMQELEELVKT